MEQERADERGGLSRDENGAGDKGKEDAFGEHIRMRECREDASWNLPWRVREIVAGKSAKARSGSL